MPPSSKRFVQFYPALKVVAKKFLDIQRGAGASDGGEVKEAAAREWDELEVDSINGRARHDGLRAQER
jgi:hypothetical protein